MERPYMVPEHPDQAPRTEHSDEQVLHYADRDLSPRGQPYSDDRDHEHDQGDARGDSDVRPLAGPGRTEDGENVGAEHEHRGECSYQRARHHQPSGDEPKIWVDGAADPFEGCAAVCVP